MVPHFGGLVAARSRQEGCVGGVKADAAHGAGVPLQRDRRALHLRQCVPLQRDRRALHLRQCTRIRHGGGGG